MHTMFKEAFAELPERLKNKIIQENCGCWIWIAAKTHNGYGVVGLKYQVVYAHRLIRHLILRDIPINHTPNTELDHSPNCCCSRRDCVNPWHTEPGTRLDNVLTSNHHLVQMYRFGLCSKGLHNLTMPENRSKDGRRCRQCNREWQRARKVS